VRPGKGEGLMVYLKDGRKDPAEAVEASKAVNGELSQRWERRGVEGDEGQTEVGRAY
jgi:hypothetical protein